MYYKYPTTYHLPWSKGVADDDKVIESLTGFEGRRVIVTEKLDGECTTMYRDYIHARSIDSPTNFTRSWVQNFHRSIAHNIPDGWRIVGENVWAEHSIRYENLKSYFYPFAVFDENNFCLSVDDMKLVLRAEIFRDLPNLKTIPLLPPVLFDGIFDEKIIEEIEIDPKKQEGYVLRTFDGFHYDDFGKHVAKFVRKNHVQTDEYWLKNARQNGTLII